MLSDLEMYERMRNGWRAGRPQTCCGNGSLLEHTANIRAWLPELVKRRGIRSVCDAGAGDLWWIAQMKWDVAYQAFDLIVRKPTVQPLDITRYRLPKCDAILCRMVLNHLDHERVLMALGLFRQSATYLIATQFTPEDKDLPRRSVEFERLDLRRAPFNLGEPIEKVQDGSEHWCSLALWKL